ncbi:MAG: C25 family cysteine peptidase [Marinifilaceae bacterium]
MKKNYYLWILFMVLCTSSFGQNRFLSFTKSKQAMFDVANSVTPSRKLEQLRSGYLQVTYEFPGAMLADKSEKGELYNFLHIKQFGKMGQVGAPALPMRNDMLVISKSVRPSVELVDAEYVEYSGYNVYPALELPFDTEGAPAPQFQKDPDVYGRDAFFPEKVVDIVSDQIMKEARMLRVQVRPVQFNPVTKTLRVYSKLVYKVHKGAEKTSVNSTKGDLQILKKMVLNPDDVQQETKRLRSDAEGESESKDYIIITHSMFDHAAKKLASWKASLGYKVDLVSKDSWTTDQVKEAIHSRYHNWNPKPGYYVILGDYEQVPAMNFKTSRGEVFASDLYYACMDGAGDYTPDIARGRISVATVEQSETVIDKIINYEKNPVNDANFYHKGLNCAQFQDVYDGEAPDGYAARRFCHTSEDIRNYVMGQGYDVQRIYYTDAANTPTHFDNGYFSNGEPLPAELLKANGFNWNGGAEDIKNAINDGRFYLFHRDHGYAGGSGWAHPEFVVDQIDGLNNGNKLPVVFSINCHTGEFKLPECFAEKFLRKENGGAVAVFGASYSSLSGPNDGLSLGMVEAIWPNPGLTPSFGNGAGVSNPDPSGFENPVTTLGDVLNLGLMRMDQTWAPGESNRLYTYRLFHFFGDPAMRMWTQAPQAIAAVMPERVECGATSLSVSGISVSDALVTVVQGDKLLAKARATTNDVVLNFDAVDNIDKLVVTVSAPNYRPVVKEYIVEGCNSKPVASFSVSKSMTILGEHNQAIKFTDLSTYSPTSWQWDFGTTNIEFVDGTDATSQNPVVKFLAKGIFTVKLTATNENGGSECIKEKAVSTYERAIAASCFGQTRDLSSNYGIGIKAFSLNTLHSSSGDAVKDGGYQDFSYIHFTTLVPGKIYNASVTVGGTNPESVKVYLDANHDGSFGEGEEIVSLENFKGEKQFELKVPYDVVLDKMLLLRVISDYAGNTITDACYASENGQTEDYAVLVKPGLATVKTLEIADRGFDFAVLKAKQISDGRGTVSERGIVVANHTLPTLEDTKLVDGSGVGEEYELRAESLEMGTSYSYRAYVINEYGVSYGDEKGFETYFGEPDAHVTKFAAELSLSTWQAMSWMDSKSTIKPWGYLIKWAKDNADNIQAPVDGVVEEANCLYVEPGEEFAVAEGLDYETHYFYKIYPYTNEGTSIDYYTAGDVPVIDASTLPFGEYLPYTSENPEKSIKGFALNTITNTAERPEFGYNDFTSMSTDLKPGQSYKLTVSFDPGGKYNYYSVAWVDWNHDGWFDKDTESIDLGAYVGPGSITKSFTVPADAQLGQTTLRYAYVYTKTMPSSWGKVSYFSAEDYSVNVDVNAVVPGLWTGGVSTSWDDVNNWDEKKIPSETTDVVIQKGSPNYPVLNSDSHVKSVTLGAEATFTIADGATFQVDNNVDIAGAIVVNGGDIDISGAFNSVLGSQVDINGGTLDMAYWGRDASSTYAKGTINLNAGVVNAENVKFSNSNVTGSMAEGFVMNVTGDLAFNYDGWEDRILGDISILSGNEVHTVLTSASNPDMMFKNLTVNTPGETVYLLKKDQKGEKDITVSGKLKIVAGTVMGKNEDAPLGSLRINELEIAEGATLVLNNVGGIITGNATGKGAWVQKEGSLCLKSTQNQIFDLNAELSYFACEGSADVQLKNDISVSGHLNLRGNHLILDNCKLQLLKDCEFVYDAEKHFETINGGQLERQFSAAVADQSFTFPIGKGSVGSLVKASLKAAPMKDASLFFSFVDSKAEGVTAEKALNAHWKFDGDDIMKTIPVVVNCSLSGIDLSAESYFWAYKENVWNTISAVDDSQNLTVSLESPATTITAMAKGAAPAVTVDDQSGRPATFVGATDQMECKLDDKEWKPIHADEKIYLNGPHDLFVRYMANENAIESVQTGDLDGDNTLYMDPILSSYEVAENTAIGTEMAEVVLLGGGPANPYGSKMAADSPNQDVFELIGNKLITKAAIDFEEKSEYIIKVEVESAPYNWTKEFTVSVIDINEAPLSIQLSTNNIAENCNIDEKVASLTTTDPDNAQKEKFTYSLVEDGVDNNLFTIIGNNLYLKASPNYEVKDSYSVKIQSTDKGDLSVVNELGITVTDANDLPTLLKTSSLEIPDDLTSGDQVSILSVEDEDQGDNANTFKYELVSCRKDMLVLDGNKVVLNGYPYVSSYSSNDYDLVVKVTEVESGYSFEQTLTFTVIDVNEAPSFSMYGVELTINENLPADTEVGMLVFYDPDRGDEVTFELLDDAGGAFRIDDGTIYTTKSFNFEEKAEYTIRAKVTDKAGLFDEDTFTVKVQDVNDVPGNLALSSNTVKENSKSKILIGTISASDEDGDDFSFNLSESAENAKFVIEENELYTNGIFDFEEKAEYSIEVLATDVRNGVNKKVFAIQIENENEAPVANAGKAQTVNEGDVVNLDASASSDPDANTTLTYSWTSVEGLALTGAGTATPSFTAPEVETNKTYTFELTVSDGELEDKTTVVVTVNNVNKAPVADAGKAQVVKEGTVVRLDASASSDADGQTLTFSWTCEEGVELTNANTATPNFTAPEVDAATDYHFVVTVSDGDLESTAKVVVTVNNVDPIQHNLVANAGEAQTVNEGDVVSLDASASTDDDPEASLTFSWICEEGIELTDANTAKPSFTAPEVDAATDYHFVVTVSNGNSEATAKVVITVNNVEPENHAPVADAGEAQTVNPGDVVDLDASASSDEDEDQLVYEWTSPDGISIENHTAAHASFVAPEVDTDTDFGIHLKVSDGTDVAETTVVITVKATITGITDVDTSIKSIDLYPNPCVREFRIRLAERPVDAVTYEVCNAIGKVVSQGKLFEKETLIPVSFASGLYFVRIHVNKDCVVKKLIVN